MNKWFESQNNLSTTKKVFQTSLSLTEIYKYVLKNSNYDEKPKSRVG